MTSTANAKLVAFDGGTKASHNVLFLLMPGFSILSFSAALETLKVANDVLGREAYVWRSVSVDTADVVSSTGITITADSMLADEAYVLRPKGAPHMVVVCGGTSAETTNCRVTNAWLRSVKKARRDIVGLDSAAFVFANAGLLEDKSCTMHWEMIPIFQEKFGYKVDVSSALFKEDNRIMTCAGRAATLDVMAFIIAKHHGEQIASRVCEVAIIERPRKPGERQRLPLRQRHGVYNEKLVRAIERMAESLDEVINIDLVSDAAQVSRRQLERLFRHELGYSPSVYYMMMRLERAHLLLIKSAIPIVEIATGCGFISASHFSKTYRTYYGVAPQQTRLAAKEIRLDQSFEANVLNHSFQSPSINRQIVRSPFALPLAAPDYAVAS